MWGSLLLLKVVVTDCGVDLSLREHKSANLIDLMGTLLSKAFKILAEKK